MTSTVMDKLLEADAGLVNDLSDSSDFVEPSDTDLRVTEQDMASEVSTLDTVPGESSYLDTYQTYLNEVVQFDLLEVDEERELGKRVQLGQLAQRALLLRDFIESSGDSRLVSFVDGSDTLFLPLLETEQELRDRVRVGKEAEDKLVRHNLRLVISLAKKFRRPEVDPLDLIQLGNVGLLRAVQNFDYRRGFRFSTYATWWIRQTLQRDSPQVNRSIYIPNHLVTRLSTLNRYERQLEQDLGREPTVDELATGLSMSATEVRSLIQMRNPTVSISTPLGEDSDGDMTLGDTLVDPDDFGVEAFVANKEKTELLNAMLDTLPVRNAMMVKYMFGFLDGVPHTLVDAGTIFGLTRERVRQLVGKSIRMLQSVSRRSMLNEYRG